MALCRATATLNQTSSRRTRGDRTQPKSTGNVKESYILEGFPVEQNTTTNEGVYDGDPMPAGAAGLYTGEAET